ncbi:VOC family protein [Luteococcus sp. H138]|uniref:VOC family protein n=1 Tax=unclassified Luteococcus TaxID=2639923 RepID=UPI00313EF12F
MPMFARIPCPDLAASVDFWTNALGFFELFGIPGQLVHLRRWAFQDVLLVPGPAASPSGLQLSFACVLSQLDEVADACRSFPDANVQGPTDMPWNTRDLTVTTPEGTRVVFTAAKPLVAGSAEEAGLKDVGIVAPR